MPKCLVVADDLTGANATGVLLKQNGFDTLTLLRDAIGKAHTLAACDCLVVPTDSRAIPGNEAYERVTQTLSLLQGEDVQLYAKRIDSTLRGNLGVETDAFLDFLGEDTLAVCVPCFPSSGRILVGSHLLVNGVALRHTEAAQDPKCPIGVSDAYALLSSQSKYPVSALHLDDVADGADALCEMMLARKREGARILLIDSITQQDMDIIADAVIKTGLRVVSVDPGPFTAAVAKRILPSAKKKPGSKVICAIGSVNGVAARQTQNLLKDMPVAAVFLEADRILDSEESRRAEISRLIIELLARKDESDVLAVIGSGIDPAKRLDLKLYEKRLGLTPDELSEKINEAFAEIVLAVINSEPAIRGVYSTGGDITAAIHRQSGTVALRLEEEIVPLAGFGQVQGGTIDGLFCISKGGMVGNEKAMVTCVTYLLDHFGA